MIQMIKQLDIILQQMAQTTMLLKQQLLLEQLTMKVVEMTEKQLNIEQMLI